MNKIVVQLAYFVAGGAIGVLCTRSFYKAKYENLANEEIESVKRAFNANKKKKNEENSSEKPENLEKKTENEDKIDNFKSSLNYGDLGVQHIDYSNAEKIDAEYLESGKLSTGISDYVPEREKFDEEAQKVAEMEHPREDGEPYLITADSYNDDYVHYAKVQATYFAPDDVIADDITHDIIDQIDVGYGNLDYLKHSEDDLIYIRNDRLGCDIELSYDTRKIANAGVYIYG